MTTFQVQADSAAEPLRALCDQVVPPPQTREEPTLPISELFPLEAGTSDGDKLRRQWAQLDAPAFPEFYPEALNQTYFDKDAGFELPVFAVFDLAGAHSRTYLLPAKGNEDYSGLDSFLPMTKVRESLDDSIFRRFGKRLKVRLAMFLTSLGTTEAILLTAAFNAQRFYHPKEAEGFWALILISAMLWLVIGIFYFLSRLEGLSEDLKISASFEGLLPQHVRQKARDLRSQFHRLYLVTDQRGRWTYRLSPRPLPPNIDPLLIGEKRLTDGIDHYYLLDVFELTRAEEYLVSEFTSRGQE